MRKHHPKPRCAAIPCKPIWRTVWARGGHVWCYGLRKATTNRPCDVVAYCELNAQGKRIDGWDITIDEAAGMIAGLAHVIDEWSEARHKRCRKSECSERETCRNASPRG